MKKWYVISLTALLTVALVMTVVPQVMAQLYALNISAEGGGTTNPLPGLYLYSPGAVVKVTAIPDAGWSLVEWTLIPGGDSTNNTVYITMNEPAYFLNAEFENNYDVTVRAACLSESAEIGVDLTMDGGSEGKTPQTFIDIEGEHTFTVPDVDEYDHPFAQWSTGETSTTITINSVGRYTALYGEKRVPGLTAWGTLVLLLMLAAAGIIVIRRRRQVAAP